MVVAVCCTIARTCVYVCMDCDMPDASIVLYAYVLTHVLLYYRRWAVVCTFMFGNEKLHVYSQQSVFFLLVGSCGIYKNGYLSLQFP